MRALSLIYQRPGMGQEVCMRIKEAVRLVFSEGYSGAGTVASIGKRNRIHRLESAGTETGGRPEEICPNKEEWHGGDRECPPNRSIGHEPERVCLEVFQVRER